MTRQEAGRRGGQETAARHGSAHMAEIGRRGFATFAARYAGGSRKLAIQYLREMGRLGQRDGGAAYRRQRWIQTGLPTFTEWLAARAEGGE